MKTQKSLRVGGESTSLRIHTKDKFPILWNTAICQLDSEIATPTSLNAAIRHIHPGFFTSLGVGVQYCRDKNMQYNVRAKKVFPVNGSLSLKIKARYDIDQDFNETSGGAAEFIWNISNVEKNQGSRLKFGYDVAGEVPYLQIQKNKWTISADGNLRCEVRYNL